jgi:hypothetical protein
MGQDLRDRYKVMGVVVDGNSEGLDIVDPADGGKEEGGSSQDLIRLGGIEASGALVLLAQLM